MPYVTYGAVSFWVPENAVKVVGSRRMLPTLDECHRAVWGSHVAWSSGNECNTLCKTSATHAPDEH